MKEIVYIDSVKKFEYQSQEIALTMGFFDGIHRGHDKLINKVTKSEKKRAIMTFDSHPRKRQLIKIDEKIKRLSQYDVDVIFIVKMNDTNIQASKFDFIKLLQKINISEIYVGDDFRFGYNAEGTLKDLELNFVLKKVDFLKNGTEKISSSNIRKNLDRANFSAVNYDLGYNYQIKGVVVKGDQIGRTINFPTANINTDYYVPNNGVYVTNACVGSKKYKSVTNIGYRPTINGNELRIETHILNFDHEIYGETIEVEFLKLIRKEVKFKGLSELKEQIKKDIKFTKEYYGN